MVYIINIQLYNIYLSFRPLLYLCMYICAIISYHIATPQQLQAKQSYLAPRCVTKETREQKKKKKDKTTNKNENKNIVKNEQLLLLLLLLLP